MIRNYLTTALRIMMRHRGYSIINLSGLTIGISCSLLIALYIFDELRYDRFHADADQIYRVAFKGKLQNEQFESAQTGAPVAARLKEACPAVESTLRLASWGLFPMRYEDKAFTVRKNAAGRFKLLRFFSFYAAAGDPDKVLRGEGSLIISRIGGKALLQLHGPGRPHAARQDADTGARIQGTHHGHSGRPAGAIACAFHFCPLT
ncbi:MAG: ABC transporter permease [Bacteroidia bacterium]|nr:ABC transporter permease [Bacteroidia bacterium]